MFVKVTDSSNFLKIYLIILHTNINLLLPAIDDSVYLINNTNGRHFNERWKNKGNKTSNTNVTQTVINGRTNKYG